MKTSAVMTRNVVVVSPAVTVGAAAAMMQRLRIRHLPIVDGGRLAGIVSDRDLMRHDDETTCAEAMTRSPVVCSSDAPISRVARLMLDNKIDSVPVVSGPWRLIGLVTSADLISLLLDRAEGEVLPFEFSLQLAASDAEAAGFAA